AAHRRAEVLTGVELHEKQLERITTRIERYLRQIERAERQMERVADALDLPVEEVLAATPADIERLRKKGADTNALRTLADARRAMRRVEHEAGQPLSLVRATAMAVREA